MGAGSEWKEEDEEEEGIGSTAPTALSTLHTAPMSIVEPRSI